MKRVMLIIGNMIAGGIVSTTGFTWVAKAEPPAEKTSAAERKILFWCDSMCPNTRLDKPGRSPSMDVDLVPKYADEGSSAFGMRVNPTQTRNLGVKTATVTHGLLTFAQNFPANVSCNEYQYVIVQTHAAGFTGKVYLLIVGDRVQKGTPLFGLTVPDWVGAQSGYLLLCEAGGTMAQTENILERPRLAGIPETDIRRLIATQEIQTRFTLKALVDDVITAFDLRAGMNIVKDNMVAKIQDMDPMWVTATILEFIIWLMKDASQFTLTIPARPGRILVIRKWTLLPGVDTATHTLRLRLEVDNADEALKPGMDAWLQLNIANEPMLLIPSQTLIDTGSEQRVITVDTSGHFVPRRVTVLQASQDVTALCSGLAEGEEMVSSGLFLVDSETSISGALERIRSGSATHAH